MDEREPKHVLTLIAPDQFKAMMECLNHIANPDYPDAKKRSHADAIKVMLERCSEKC